ncbi:MULTISPECIES: DUF3562 domain-containing protein [Burkholderia]|jgi:predicted transcriptional regulator|uniref:DUF3562 domain-containing protein n=1 Tax=Burkholderia gladioli TaxID=28095 RepID=A0A095W0C3_BURGA|nr:MULTISPECIES: DUF3562 domain-containing protein [Burkholderia]AJW97613.1 hypothetical protein BM43_3295 [Burkholderia gladioli]ASD79238.1 hypothetical protein CEJ98_09610 [Burkholderia gladioli pv. gladioli]ATF84357.1 DUF3562 domain-containing protein [Burkholderia gladioli pv. gladioli]AWY55523.1 hypothetical protein A8H28_31550 [Burkholderia gladioli pv. gladioli]AYQ88300.1 DUF3562 domain-containing protein [Burkholderia gladioli]
MAAQINVEEIVESIASETRMPKETVSELYEKTLAEYRDGARILDYVALLAAKRVRDDLRQQKRH